VKNATLKVYPGAPHGLTDSHKVQLNIDLLAFLGAQDHFTDGIHKNARFPND
jgi:hypothetical protein